AAAALWNLSDNCNQVKIAAAGAIPPLVELVRSGRKDQKNVATGALWNLAFENSNQEEILTNDAVDPLINLVCKGTSVQRERASGVLGFLSQHLSSGDKVTIAVIEALVTFVETPSNNKWIHEGLTALLGLASDGNVVVCDGIVNADGLMTLEKVVQDGDERNMALAARLLQLLQ
ncbi:hypothetical protein PHMEG_00036015, partial [Phytophthora megakarya]